MDRGRRDRLRARGRRRTGALVVAAALIALSCSSHGDAAGDEGDTPGREAVAEQGPEASGTFGTMAEPVCGPGEASGATDQGVSDTIKVGVLGDASSELVPDLNKELFDASKAFVKWCNAAGGIGGRTIELTERDAGLLRAREVMTEACASDFAVVGGGLALDYQGVSVRTGCGLLEIPGFSNSVDARETDHQVQPLPQYRTNWPVTQYRQIAEAFPDSIGKFGVMLTTAQLGSGRPFDQRLMDAIGPLGYKLAYKGDLPPPPVPVENWRPYVEEMKAKGVKVLDFEVTPEYLVPLLRAMRDVGWYPDAIVLPANFYNQTLLEAGDALRNTWVNQYIHPYEKASENPPTKQFMDLMDTHAPGWKQAGLAVNSFSAWLLFARAAKACGSDLTRDCVEANARDVGAWDGGGLHAPWNPDTKADPQPTVCGVLLEATASGFAIDEARTEANRGIYNCSTANAASVAP